MYQVARNDGPYAPSSSSSNDLQANDVCQQPTMIREDQEEMLLILMAKTTFNILHQPCMSQSRAAKLERIKLIKKISQRQGDMNSAAD